MQILLILWEPNEKWRTLTGREQADYLRSLDGAINEARSHGVMTLGWSRVDRTLNKAPEEGYAGVFAMNSAQAVHELDKNIQQSFGMNTSIPSISASTWKVKPNPNHIASMQNCWE